MGRSKQKGVDRFFLGIVITLLIIGTFIFLSASIGVLAREQDTYFNILVSQLVLGLVGGSLALYITSKIHYTFWRSYAFVFFLLSVIVTALVFVPGLGFSHGGAQRWLSLGPISFQPAEFLKIAFVLYLASWLAWANKQGSKVTQKIIPLAVLSVISAALLLVQPDTKSLLLILVAGITMLFMSGVKWKYVLMICLTGMIGLLVLASFKPYLTDRIQTFIDPSRDPQGSSYQLKQSLIAIGSGKVFGRGYGQSVQKFNYLPEPHGDSVFAVVGEEFGYIGSSLLILLYVVFAFRGFRIAYRAPDGFSRLFVIGAVILIVAQSFLNIASIIGVFPLTGVPLVFVSHGGTSLFISLALVGVILNISRYQKRIR